MKKSDLFFSLSLENTDEGKALFEKLTFLKEMFFKDELNEYEKRQYLDIHSREALRAFVLSSELKKKFDEYLKKKNQSQDLPDDFGRIIESIFGLHSENIEFNHSKKRLKNEERVAPEEMDYSNPKLVYSAKPDDDPWLDEEPEQLEESKEPLEETTPLVKDEGKAFVVDPEKKYLCKYHHNVGCTSDISGDGFSTKRCPGCGKYYVELSGSSNYVANGDSASSDDENDIGSIQDAYDPPEAIYDDDGNIEYW